MKEELTGLRLVPAVVTVYIVSHLTYILYTTDEDLWIKTVLIL